MDTTTIDPKLLNSPLFQELMAEGLAMQDRFAAEPVYAKTGKGYLKSAGVDELKKIKVLAKHGSHLAPRDEPRAIAGKKGFRTF
jgi:hypothetical protein